MIKRLFAVLMTLGIVLIGFVACESNREYAQALVMLKKGEYEEAYELLLSVGEYKDAQELLAHFHYVPVSISYQYYSAQGDETGTPSVYAFSYNEDNLPVQMSYTGSRGEFTNEYVYDENGRLILRVYTSAEDSYTYQTCYDDKGNITKKTTGYYGNAELYSEYFYDENGNVIEEIEYSSFKGEVSRKGACRFTYSTDGKLIKEERVKDEDAWTIEYVYDEQDNLIQTNELGKTYKVTIDYTYDQNGNLIIEKGDSYVITKEYDERGNLIHYEYKFTYASKSEYVYDATYDADGKLISEYSVNSTNTVATEYLYDEDGNLKQKNVVSQIKGYEPDSEQFFYDQAGNIIKRVYLDSSGMSEEVKVTYQLVYIPYELPETFLNSVSSLLEN